MDFDYTEEHEAEFDALSVSIRPNDDDGCKPQERYPAKLHAERVVKELGVDDGLIYLAGQPSINLEDSDQPRPFRQRRYFFYIAGVNFPDCHATYEIAARRLILWVPSVEARDVLWYGARPSPAQCLQMTDVDEVRLATRLPDFIKRWGGGGGGKTVLFVLHDDQTPPGAADTQSDQTKKQSDQIKVQSDKTKVDATRLQPAMDAARVIKTDYEVAMMRRANAVSSIAHRRVAHHLLRLESEGQIEALFQLWCSSHGARDQAYPIIAASGRNASTLHYAANADCLRGRQLVVLDAGCEWACYASDVTRTLPLGGAFSPCGLVVHQLVQRMQDACIQRVAAGVSFAALHLRAAGIAVDGLLDAGLLRGDRAEIVRAGTVAAFFPHGLGHHVGLEVHDVAPHPLLGVACGARLEDGKRAVVSPAALVAMHNAHMLDSDGRKRHTLKPNMVVTIEPGIYFCREYLEGYFLSNPTHARFIDAACLEHFYPVGGVRIEDCVLVTQTGCEVLTTAPKGRELLDVINHRR